MSRIAYTLSAAAVAVATVVAAGCSSSSKSSSVQTSGATTTAAPSSSGSSASGDQIPALIAAVKAGEQLTYKAVYIANESGQAQTTVTIEQKPPKYLFATGQGSVISNGSTTYFCSGSGASKNCVSSTGGSPLAALTQVFSPSAAITAMQQADVQFVAHAAGYHVTFSSQTFAGQSSTCVAATGNGQTGKYCVTKNGLLAYAGNTSTSYFQLTSLTTSVSDADFAVSAASTVTMPPGVTVPSGY
jgi:hypothetical protein